MTMYEMVDLIESFGGDFGKAVQFVARKHPKDLELCYETVAWIRGKS